MMNARDISVGDRLQLTGWGENDYVTVTGIGDEHFLARASWPSTGEDVWTISDAWHAYVTPFAGFPERWVNVYDAGIGSNHRTRAAADAGRLPCRPVLGVIHLYADGHVEMEQA